jgi:hypothetical protein
MRRLWWKRAGKIQRERPKRAWKGYITMDLQETHRDYVDRIDVALEDEWRAILNTVMNLQVP